MTPPLAYIWISQFLAARPLMPRTDWRTWTISSSKKAKASREQPMANGQIQSEFETYSVPTSKDPDRTIDGARPHLEAYRKKMQKC